MGLHFRELVRFSAPLRGSVARRSVIPPCAPWLRGSALNRLLRWP